MLRGTVLPLEREMLTLSKSESLTKRLKNVGSSLMKVRLQCYNYIQGKLSFVVNLICLDTPSMEKPVIHFLMELSLFSWEGYNRKQRREQ